MIFDLSLIFPAECSVARDASDTTKADVLFLLDSSTVFNESNFKGEEKRFAVKFRQ